MECFKISDCNGSDQRSLSMRTRGLDYIGFCRRFGWECASAGGGPSRSQHPVRRILQLPIAVTLLNLLLLAGCVALFSRQSRSGTLGNLASNPSWRTQEALFWLQPVATVMPFSNSQDLWRGVTTMIHSRVDLPYRNGTTTTCHKRQLAICENSPLNPEGDNLPQLYRIDNLTQNFKGDN